MKRLPECRSMNFPVYSGLLDQFKDDKDLESYYQQGGLNGLEVILAGESDQGKIRPDMVNGVHLFFHIFWMDFWLRDFDRLDEEFDSREQWIEFYGGFERDAYLEPFRRDLAYAEEIGAKYVVFHVSEVTLRESFTYKYKYTDRQVIDAAIETINILMSEREYSFDFLVENLWWSGLTMKEPRLTRRLIEGIEYEKKGLMLDVGHYMNTNSRLRSAQDALPFSSPASSASGSPSVPEPSATVSESSAAASVSPVTSASSVLTSLSVSAAFDCSSSVICPFCISCSAI